MRFVLASSSPARLTTLRKAGVQPEVLVPDVDESAVAAPSPRELVAELARVKADAVLPRLDDEPGQLVLVACDTMLELDGKSYGKPGSPEAAERRWQAMRGRQALLHTGHDLVVQRDGVRHRVNRVATTSVTFADLDDDEIRAYAATGEPQKVAGAFTIDSLGGPFVTRIEGDPHNVVGISLPLVRQMLLDLGVAWHTLWHTAA